MPTTMIALAKVNPNSQDAAKSYSARVQEILKGYEVKPLHRLKISEQLVGETLFDINLLIEFKSADDIKLFLNSEAYKEVIPLREKGFSSMQIYIAE